MAKIISERLAPLFRSIFDLLRIFSFVWISLTYS